ETNTVEEIEKLAAELQIQPALSVEPIILDKSDIEVVRAVIAHVRQGPAGVSERERRRLAEYAGVEPLREALVGISGQKRGFSVVVGPRSSSKGVREIGRGPRNSGVPLSAV